MNAGTPNGAPITSVTSPSRKTVAIERTGTAAQVARVVTRKRKSTATSTPGTTSTTTAPTSALARATGGA